MDIYRNQRGESAGERGSEGEADNKISNCDSLLFKAVDTVVPKRATRWQVPSANPLLLVTVCSRLRGETSYCYLCIVNKMSRFDLVRSR